YWQTKVNDYKNTFSQRAEKVLLQIDQYPRSFTVQRIDEAEPESEITLHWTPSESPLQRPISYRLLLGSTLDLELEASMILDNISDTLVSFNAPAEEGLYYYKVQSYDGFVHINGFDTYNPLVVTDNVPDLVINEINYNSSPDFDAGDWVELYNPESVSINLSDWQLKDNQNDHVFTFDSATSIPANGYLVICREIVPFQSSYPNVSEVIGELPYVFSNGGDSVRLFHSSGLMVDEVIFQDTTPWPIHADGLGPTLELNNPSLDNMLPENWTAWTDNHGTPGATNMQGTRVWEELDDVFIGIHPNPIQENAVTIYIEGSKGQDVHITVSDLLGRTVYTSSFSINAGIKNRVLLYPHLQVAGNYLVNLRTNSFDKTVKVLYSPSTSP
ncbi:MAG: lamin tail domain-containing protein, partial [Flavobacteriales bacterium]|nr:lamin tail domain-containing protein [Flavobacteriales bacterium]